MAKAKKRADGRVLVQIRMPGDVLEFLRSRVRGTPIKLEHYVNAILTVEVVRNINSIREDEARWDKAAAGKGE